MARETLDMASRHHRPNVHASIAASVVMLSLAGLSLAGCNEVLGIDEPLDDAGGPGSSSGGFGGTPAGTGGAGGTRGGGTGGGGTGGGAGDGGPPPGGSNGGGPDGGGRTVEFAWADWPMPNPATSGLPYPQTYDTTATIGIVMDRVTGLKWQQSIDANAYTWADAHAYCAGLTFAGGGWRLPSRIELLSIVDFTNPNPVIDVRAFPATPQARFWSASPMADDTQSAWTVDFAFGNGLAYGGSTGTAYRVRCVR